MSKQKLRVGAIAWCAAAAAVLTAALTVLTGLSLAGKPDSVSGIHQAGIIDTPPAHAMVGALDVVTTDREELRALFRDWSRIAGILASGGTLGGADEPGNLPPEDTGEARGLDATGLTITFGVGPSLFDNRFGLASRRPAALIDLPAFAGDALNPEWSGGDLCIQVCARDPQVAFHAMRTLVRAAQGRAVLRWSQTGFSSAGGKTGTTVRNLQGFIDGTVNPGSSNPQARDEVVWARASDGASWMDGGSYLVVRRIRMLIEVWDRSSLTDQEHTIGRSRANGAAFGSSTETDEPNFTATGSNGEPVIPADSHIRLARGEGKEQILRRGFSYVNGVDPLTGQWDAGLLFLGWQRDPRAQFVPIQKRLASDALGEYTKTVGSAVFACFPGIRQGDFYGSTLFE